MLVDINVSNRSIAEALLNNENDFEEFVSIFSELFMSLTDSERDRILKDLYIVTSDQEENYIKNFGYCLSQIGKS